MKRKLSWFKDLNNYIVKFDREHELNIKNINLWDKHLQKIWNALSMVTL